MSEYTASGQLMPSLAEAGMSYALHCHYLETDADYLELFLFLQGMIPQKLQDQMVDMALNGIEKPVIHFGEVTDWYREKSWKATDAALRMLSPNVEHKSPMVLKSNEGNMRGDVNVVQIDELKVVILKQIEAEKKRRGILDVTPDVVVESGYSELPAGAEDDADED